jgi:hypothetical protein
MWPWDGTKGRVMDDEKSRANHPDENPFPQFPKSPIPGQWPTSDSKPMPADMIDYLGLSSTRLRHGVSYDDVPYGVRPQGGPSPMTESVVSIASVLAETARDNRAPLSRRTAALSMLRAAGQSRPETVFQAVASDRAAPAQVRQHAATNLIDVSPAAGMATVLALVDQGGNGVGPLTAAIVETASFAHRGKLPADVGSKMHHLLIGVASNPRHPQAVRAAIALAEMVDADAAKYLLGLLKAPKVGDAVRAELIAALPLSAPGTRPTLRDALEKALRDNDVETALAALRALAGDEDTRALRLRLVDDENVDLPVNRGAMRSLMHETPVGIPKLLAYIEGTLQPTDSRRLEAAGAFRVTIESFKPFPRTQVDEWKTKIRTVRDGLPNTGTELKDALSMILEVLERAAS